MVTLKHLLEGMFGKNIRTKNDKKHSPVAFTFTSQIVTRFLLSALNLKA